MSWLIQCPAACFHTREMDLHLCQVESEAEITASNNNSLPRCICQEQLAERTRGVTYHQHTARLRNSGSRGLLLACHSQTAGCDQEPGWHCGPHLVGEAEGGGSQYSSAIVTIVTQSFMRNQEVPLASDTAVMQRVLPTCQAHPNKNPRANLGLRCVLFMNADMPLN